MSDLVLYHDDADGFCAAWVFHKFRPDVEFRPANFGDEIPGDVGGRNVFLLDFHFKRNALLTLAEKAKSVVVLDHHPTTEQELGDFDFVIVGKDKAGCRMVWDYFQEGRQPPPVPRLVDYVEDRDLWRFNLFCSEEINTAIASYPTRFDTWDTLEARLCDDFMALVGEGVAIRRYQEKLIEKICSKAGLLRFEGHTVRWANTSILNSEVGQKLAGGMPFSVTFYRRSNDLFTVELRSDENGLDVGELARKYGGGGHVHAAGFETVAFAPKGMEGTGER